MATNMFLKPTPVQVHYWILQGLIMLGYFFHQVEDWRDKTSCFVTLAALLGFIFFERFRNWIFLLFMSYGVYHYADLFPNLANHSNLSFFLLLLLLPTQIKVTIFKSDSDYGDLIRTFRITVFVLYFFTIFHKLNWDFLDPDVSCANDKLKDYIRMIPPQYIQLSHWVRLINPYVGWVIEGIVPLCLLVPRWRRFGIFFLVVLHFVLAPMGFTDFSSLAMAFAWVFVIREGVQPERAWRHFQFLVIASVLMELGFAPWRYTDSVEADAFAEGILFALIYLPFLLTHCRGNIDVGRLKFPRFVGYYLFIVLFFLFGFSNYLGLRTAGTFSMFSNLQTEGETSNHIFLSTNPFKIWDFQEDAVKVISVDPSIQAFYRGMPSPKQKIPVIEFSRILDRLKEKGRANVQLEVEYKKRLYYTDDANHDEEFRFDVPWWQKKLFKFRLIQRRRPQLCHW